MSGFKYAVIAATIVFAAVFTPFDQALAEKPKLIPSSTPKVPQSVRTIPYEQNGVTVGLRLQNVTPESTFGRAGFLSEDVIKLLNGTPIKSLGQVMEIVGDNEVVKAVVLRKGETIDFKFPGLKARKLGN